MVHKLLLTTRRELKLQSYFGLFRHVSGLMRHHSDAPARTVTNFNPLTLH